MTERTAAARVHGRYLVVPPVAPGPAPILAGFHGYAEDAEEQMQRLQAIPEAARWLCVSIQALHPFYRGRSGRVVGSWMTSQQRESAIVDNIAWVTACLDAVAAEWPVIDVGSPAVVFAGFSQGVSMAFRAAAASPRGVAGVIATGGDVPPEIEPAGLRRISAALIARGSSDEWYTKEKFAQDERRLLDCSVNVQAIAFQGGHEWSDEVRAAASDFLRELHPGERCRK